MLKNGSCATRGCEPCQVGNQAALSGLSGVPRGSLFGVEVAVTVCRGIFEVRVYGSIRRNEIKRVCGSTFCVPLRAFFVIRAVAS